MKRSNREVAGGPMNRAARSDVAGRSIVGGRGEVLTIPSAAEPSSVLAVEANLLAGFAEFMSVEEALPASSPGPSDSTFKERLRRRIWRTFVLSSFRGSDTTH